MKQCIFFSITLMLIVTLLAVGLYSYRLNATQMAGDSLWNRFWLSRRQGFYESKLVHAGKRLQLCENITQRSQYVATSMITAENTDESDYLCWYVIAAQKLAYSLRSFLQMDMVLMIFDSKRRITQAQRDSLEQSGWQLCDIPAIDAPVSTGSVNRYHKEKLFSKLWVWMFVEYDAVMYTDADMIALASPAPIFTDTIPLMRSSNTGLSMSGFNAGFLVLLPSSSVFQHMLVAMHNASCDTTFAEQDFLNWYWKDTKANLVWGYNTNADAKTYVHISAQLSSPIRIIFLHFIHKPWYDGVRDWDAESIRNFWLRVPPHAGC